MGLIGSAAHVPGPIKTVAPEQATIKEDAVLMKVLKRDDKWVVTTEDGSKVLGTHDTKEEALAQLRAIEASKARAKRERHLGPSVTFSAPLGSNGRVRTGVWDRGETFGRKPKDGVDTIFNVSTLTQFVDNWIARGEPLSVCYNHQTAYVAQNGAPAPALAYHDAAVIVADGKIVKFSKLMKSNAVPPNVEELSMAVKALATDEDPDPIPDGCWWYRGEVTPLGEELLPNFKFLSPMFVTDGEDEFGNQIGYTIYDHAATNTAFQAGCMIQFEASGEPKLAPLLDCKFCGQRLADIDFDGRLPTHVGRDGLPCAGSEEFPPRMEEKIEPEKVEPEIVEPVKIEPVQGASGTAKKGGHAMARKFDEGIRKRIGFEEEEEDAKIMQAFSRYCMEAAKKFEEESRKILEEEEEEEEAKKLARMEAVKRFEEEAKRFEEDARVYEENFKDGEKKEGDEETEAPHVIMRKLARRMNKFAKMASFSEQTPPLAQPTKMEEESKVKMEEEGEEEEAKKQLANRFEMAPEAVTFSRVLTHINAKLTGAEQVALLQEKINDLEKKDAERALADKMVKAQVFARTAIDQARTTEDKRELIEKTYVKEGEEAAKALLFEENTFKALRVYTQGGDPPTHKPPQTKFEGIDPAKKHVEFDKAVRETMANDKVDYSTAMDRVFKKSPELYDR